NRRTVPIRQRRRHYSPSRGQRQYRPARLPEDLVGPTPRPAGDLREVTVEWDRRIRRFFEGRYSMTVATFSVLQRRLTLLLLAARRTDYLKAIFIRLVLLIIVILLILVGLHGRLDVLDPFLERLHAPEARLVIFRPTLRTPHDPHGPLFERPKEAT